ncbi:MAG: hemolysin family protein [Azonexus sp.]|jgi:CBS domain containing-hemolysin-like protein|uniref:hemolysin family protein n=1 Tax=Azonexus sp. TaxID=1872668 RepID=UPI00282ABBEF|nr:hemolysin family protein [Azonexus sp.]MDR0776057.1 hemolysin family protein [Azonexus sp.]
MGNSLFLIVVAIFLVLLNGFFVAAEFGLVKLRQTRVKAIAKSYGWRGRILARVHQDLDAYLSACQLGITLASLGLGWVGEPAFADLLRPLLTALGIGSARLIHGISFFTAFFIISYLHIVVGELAPKSIAIRLSEKVGLWTAPPLYAFYWAMYPAIWLLNHSANWVLRKAHLDIARGHDSDYSAEELKIILRTSHADQGFTQDEWRVLAQALDFRALEVADLMRPFREAVTLSDDDPLTTSLEKITQHRYSRYPYLDAEGNIKGVVHLKDVFIALQKSPSLESLEKLVRPAQVVSPRLPATELFRRFREGAPHFAIVAFENAHPLGYITLDNLLGALVGEIRDEFRQAQNEWSKLDDGSLIGKGSLPIFTLERALGIDIEESGVESVGGRIMQRLGDLPEEGQRLEFPQFDVVVKKMNGPRIVLVRVMPHTAPRE